jgi:hypothetical protein
MMTTIFRFVFPAFLFMLALVAGGATYQAVSVVPYWQEDLSMFRNYQWGIDYFPILSPIMTVLWLLTVISGWKVKFPHKSVFYIGHGFALLMLVSTFAYFAPFLLTYMGHPEKQISDQELYPMLRTWIKLDTIRQSIGLIPLALYIYAYGKAQLAVTEHKDLTRKVLTVN